ncbi:MAG TPA: signal recognition particle-docking protein FtsY [Chloroflexota bacterium]|jgi:fused signal recognition particle receptor|nr:signal recognition particle-docking protein FtsY [Chloroflexota bacterium]
MILSRFFKLERGAEKSREGVFARLASIFEQPRPIDDELWTELEDLLLEADVGVKTTDQLLEILHNEVELGNAANSKDLYRALQDELVLSLEEVAPKDPQELLPPGGELGVLLVVGVNGVGKTTSIAKLADYYKSQGRRVMLAAADTFRAAAIDQLKLWGDRVGASVVAQNPGSDPGSVVFDAVAAARARGIELLIVDTAGRLHTKVNLMEELRKIRRVLDRQNVSHVRTLLVLDASTGQNAIVQGRAFKEATGLDGLVLAKLDGTAKGGVVFAIVDELEIPVLFVGTGERVADLSEFDANAFVRALFKAA